MNPVSPQSFGGPQGRHPADSVSSAPPWLRVEAVTVESIPR